MRTLKNFLLVGTLLGLLVTLGCTKTFVITEPVPSSVTYFQNYGTPVRLAMADIRGKEDQAISSGTLPVRLKNMENEIDFMGQSVESELRARGINLSYVKDGAGDLTLKVKKYRIRNLRTTGFSPYWTFTTFSADIEGMGKSKIVAFYFKRGKVPVWAFKEVEEPCYITPVSLMVKEVASKINRYYFGLQASDEKVTNLVADIHNGFNENSFMQVLELGYTNNPAAVAPLIEFTSHSDSMVRACAICSLGVLGAAGQFEFLKQKYHTTESVEKQMALKAIGDLDTGKAMDFMRSVKNSDDYDDPVIRDIVDLYL